MTPVTQEIRPPWKGPTFRQLRPAYRSGLICAVAGRADVNMLETTSTQYVVLDTRVMMQEPFVRNLTAMGEVYNGLERIPASNPLGIGSCTVSPAHLLKVGRFDYMSIFCRAIGMNAMFAAPPAFESLSEEFLRNYHRYADALYETYMQLDSYRVIDAKNFHFALYASGEYSRMLEAQWEQQPEE